MTAMVDSVACDSTASPVDADMAVYARRKTALLGGLTGAVLEIGARYGANIPHFPPASTGSVWSPTRGRAGI